MKSTVRWYQGRCVIGKGKSVPAGRARGTLAWTQAVFETKRCTSANLFGHQYLQSFTVSSSHFPMSWFCSVGDNFLDKNATGCTVARSMVIPSGLMIYPRN